MWPNDKVCFMGLDGDTYGQVCRSLASAQLLNSGHVVPLQARAKRQFRAGRIGALLPKSTSNSATLSQTELPLHNDR